MNDYRIEVPEIQKGILDLVSVLRLTRASLNQNFLKLISSVGYLLLVFVLLDLMYGLWATSASGPAELGLGEVLIWRLHLGFIMVIH